MTPNYAGLLRSLLPELALALGALLVLGVDLLAGRGRSALERLRFSVSVGAVALLVAAYLTADSVGPGAGFGGVLAADVLAGMTRLGVLTLALFAVALLPGARALAHPAEYVAVTLFATIGFTLMAAAQQLLLAFLAIELASLSLYILAGFDKTRPESAEAGLKYFLFGGMSAAFLLFGLSLIYGLTGSIELGQIATSLAQGSQPPLLSVALVMVLVAFGFKAAAAPFHLWAPDVYQGAPASSAALIASASKLAGITIFTRLLWPGFGAVAGGFGATSGRPGWLLVVAVVAGVSLLLGNLAALAQSNVRRLLAYSAIAHAGVMLLGVMVTGSAGTGPVFYYAMTYGLATVGAFGVIGAVERSAGRCEQLSDLTGLHRRSPLLAGCLFVYVLSLAGIPPLAGFFAKFGVFAAALQVGGLASPFGWLALLGIAMSAVGLYYYLVVLKQALVQRPAADAVRLSVTPDVAFTLVVAAVLVVFLGLFPSVILRVF
jgi:NADH-quinone oxidoreductase subunit N